MRKTSVAIKCKQCGKEIERKLCVINDSHTGNFFCSRSCNALWMFTGDNHPRWNGQGKVKLNCLHCQKEFTVKRHMSRRLNRRFCSLQCWHQYQAQQTPKVVLECSYCSKEFSYPENRKRRPTFCSLQCRTAVHKLIGERNPNWKGGISSERDRIKATEEYKNWRLSVYRRDRFKCVCCLRNDRGLQAHHLKPFRDRSDLWFSVDNGITLCDVCHKQTYNCEYEIEAFLRNRILRDFKPDTRIEVDLVKIKSELHGDMQRAAEMTAPASLALACA